MVVTFCKNGCYATAMLGLDLLTGEAHADPYTWLVVLVAHAGLGAALWLLASGRGTWRGVLHASAADLRWPGWLTTRLSNPSRINWNNM